MAKHITDIERKGARWLLEAEADRYRATIATLTERVEELEVRLRKAEQHRLAERTSRPEWESFLTLRYGEACTILVLLQDGQISVAKACEALAELAHGVPPRIPEPQGEALPDDVIPSKRIAELEAQLAEAKKDGERLDFLERGGWSLIYSPEPEQSLSPVWSVGLATETTIRAAIDAAKEKV